jgi:hypothetical protein
VLIGKKELALGREMRQIKVFRRNRIMRVFASSLVGIGFAILPLGVATAATAPRAVDFGKRLPVAFEANCGQSNPEVKFIAHGAGRRLILTADGLMLSPISSRSTASYPTEPFRLRLLEANPSAEIAGRDRLTGTANYFVGADPNQWHVGVPRFAKVRYSEVYPGIDLVYYGNGRQVECDFIVAAGADPDVIRFAVDRRTPATIDSQGDIIFRAADGEVRLRCPVIYQKADSGPQPVAGAFVINEAGQIRFQIGPYDASRPLIIDPILVFSTFMGGNNNETGAAIGIDTSANVLVAGTTDSSDFPVTNAFQSTKGSTQDGFVVKLDSTGSNLVYATYFGGNNQDFVNALAVDGAGNVYLAGQTSSPNLPTSVGTFQATLKGGTNAFVVVLGPAGTNIVYATYLGGDAADAARGIAVDAAGNAFVTGLTSSENFPRTVDAFKRSLQGGTDAFVTELGVGGSNLVYSSYLGGSGDDAANAIAIDTIGNAYITGLTQSTNFPTRNQFQNKLDQGAVFGSGQDAFVTEFQSDGANLIYSTFLGGGDVDTGYGIAVDSTGAAYVTGFTRSTNFPKSSKPFQGSLDRGNSSIPMGDAFVTKLSPGGASLTYSTYLGGGNADAGFAIAVDADGDACVTGGTLSGGFPILNPVQTSCRSCSDGLRDAFVSKFGPAGTNLVYSTFLGGKGDDAGVSIAFDPAGSAFLTGFTGSDNFPRAFPVQLKLDGPSDAFITEIAETTVYDLALTSIKAPKSITLSATKSISTNFIAVEIQNRSPHNETIPDLATLGNLVSLSVQSTGACPNPPAVLATGKPQKSMPVTLKPKGKLKVQFMVIFDCVNDPAKTAKTANHSDYSFTANVDHSALGNADGHPEDDDCPRSVTPPFEIDPYPDGTIKDKGCGNKQSDGTLGADIFTDLVVKP